MKLVYTFPEVGDRIVYCGYMDNDYDVRVKLIAEADSFSIVGDTLMRIRSGKVVWARP